MRNALVLALVVVTAVVLAVRLLPDGDPPRLVLVVSLDTLRADHLGCYGYGRDTTPVLDRFAAEDAVLFERAYGNAPWTLPSHMSLFTGRYPDAHGMGGLARGRQVAREFLTLGEAFRAAGYRTAAFTDGAYVDASFGFGRGFELYEDHGPVGGFEAYGERVCAWLDAHAGEDQLVFLHSYDVHAPYKCPEPWWSKFEGTPPGRELPRRSLLAMGLTGSADFLRLQHYATVGEVVDDYDGCLAFADHELGKVFDHVRALGLWEDATILVVSDHGEEFLDEGFWIGHGSFMNLPVLRVPFLLKDPRLDAAGTRVERPVELVDGFTTLLGALGATPPEGNVGTDLVRALCDDAWPKAHAFGLVEGLDARFLVDDGRVFFEGAKRPWLAFQTVLPETPGGAEGYAHVDMLGVRRAARYGPEVVDADTGVALAGQDAALAELAARTDRLREVSEADYLPPTERDRQPASADSLAALGYAGHVESLRERRSTPMPPWTDLVEHPDVDWEAFFEADEILWELRRTFSGWLPQRSAAELRARLEEARALVEAVRRARPDQELHAAWRLASLDAALVHLDR